MTAYYRTMQKASDVAVNMAASANGATVSIAQIPKVSKAAQLGLKALSIAGNMLAMWAISKAISLAAKAIDDYVHRLDNAKEALEETQSELESVNSEIETTKSKIKELEALDPSSLSITDKEDLQRLKDQNEELRIRQQYLDKQAQEDAKKVADLTKEKYNSKYGSSATREDVDSYKKLYEQDNTQQRPVSNYLTGDSTYQTSSYAAGQQNSGYQKYTNNLPDLIAQYEYFEEQKKKAIQNEDNEAIEKYNKKLEETATKLRVDRTELQGFSDDLSATGESSPELEDILRKLKLIDDTLLTKGQNLVNFINSDTIKDDKEKLVALANSGELTADELAKNFSEVDSYLKENGLTLEDLISIIKIYKEELSSVGDESAISFSDIFSLKDAENNLTDLGKINEEIDKFQSAYKGLKEAMDSYNETGTFTLDQVQEIISYGGDYLKYLMDENGNLQLNEEALNKVAIARINEMRAKALSNLMDNLDKITNEKQALEYLRDQLLDTATAYDALTASRIKAWSEKALENGISQGTINKVKKSFKNQVSAINEMFNNISVDSIYKSSSSSVSSATKDAEQATKDYIDSYMNYMEKSLDSGRIDYQTYSRDVANFLKNMYDQGKIAAKDYHDYSKQMLEVQKDAMDGVISAVTYRIDKEIDAIKSQQDAIQDTIDKLREENDEKERAIELEKARYELARAQAQRTVKLYSGTDKGFIYSNDNKAVRDAQENLSNLEFEEIIKGLEKEKDALNDSIDELEKYKDKWNDIAKQHEIKINEMYASSILGADWESQILSGRIDTLNSFANSYFAIQQAIADAAWASANEQIKAAQEAAKAADGNTGGSGKVSDESTTTTTKKSNTFKQLATNSVAVKNPLGTSNKQALTGATGSLINDVITSPLKKKKKKKYGTGTDNAEPGWHIVSENGKEIIRDNYGNAYVAEGKQLHYFEGGETVIKTSESAKILANMDNLTPLQDYTNLLSGLNFQPIDYSSMVMGNLNLPDFSKLAMNRGESTTISIGDIHLHEVQNVPDFAKALQKHLPNISVQYNGKH